MKSKTKQTHKYREQIGGCQEEQGRERSEIGNRIKRNKLPSIKINVMGM